MTIYDFKCYTCETLLEDVILSIKHTQEDVPKCEKCQQPMQKEYSTFSAHFKGSGFHGNEYHAPTRGY